MSSCTICNRGSGLFISHTELLDGHVCNFCLEEHGVASIDNPMMFDGQSILTYLKERKNIKDTFNMTHEPHLLIQFDSVNKIFVLTDDGFTDTTKEYFKFSELDDYRLNVDTNTTIDSDSSGVGLQLGNSGVMVGKGSGSAEATEELESAEITLYLTAKHKSMRTIRVYSSSSLLSFFTTKSSVLGSTRKILDTLEYIYANSEEVQPQQAKIDLLYKDEIFELIKNNLEGYNHTSTIENDRLRVKIWSSGSDNRLTDFFIDLTIAHIDKNAFEWKNLEDIIKVTPVNPKHIVTVKTGGGKLSIEIETPDEELEDDKISIADEISKLKKLLDEGVLTQEEFEKAKSKMLI